MASAAFERFRFSFFEDPDSPRNGLDLKALAALEGEERSRAEDMLLQYLPDTRGVIGLGALGSRRAEPALVRPFEASEGSDSSEQVYLAKALWQIQPNPRWLDAVIEVARLRRRAHAAAHRCRSALPFPRSRHRGRPREGT